MFADSGGAIADLAVLRDQGGVFGPVASTPTAWRLLADTDGAVLASLRAARASLRLPSAAVFPREHRRGHVWPTAARQLRSQHRRPSHRGAGRRPRTDLLRSPVRHPDPGPRRLRRIRESLPHPLPDLARARAEPAVLDRIRGHRASRSCGRSAPASPCGANDRTLAPNCPCRPRRGPAAPGIPYRYPLPIASTTQQLMINAPYGECGQRGGSRTGGGSEAHDGFPLEDHGRFVIFVASRMPPVWHIAVDAPVRLVSHTAANDLARPRGWTARRYGHGLVGFRSPLTGPAAGTVARRRFVPRSHPVGGWM